MLNHIISHQFPSNKIKNIEDIPNLKNSMLTNVKKQLIDDINKKYIISYNFLMKMRLNLPKLKTLISNLSKNTLYFGVYIS